MSGDNENQKATIAFMNKDITEMNSFLTKMRTKARQKSPNTLKIFEFGRKGIPHEITAEGAVNIAEQNLYDLIVDNTKCDTLIATLTTRYF